MCAVLCLVTTLFVRAVMLLVPKLRIRWTTSRMNFTACYRRQVHAPVEREIASTSKITMAYTAWKTSRIYPCMHILCDNSKWLKIKVPVEGASCCVFALYYVSKMSSWYFGGRHWSLLLWSYLLQADAQSLRQWAENSEPGSWQQSLALPEPANPLLWTSLLATCKYRKRWMSQLHQPVAEISLSTGLTPVQYRSYSVDNRFATTFWT